jgi:hypothetical protein
MSIFLATTSSITSIGATVVGIILLIVLVATPILLRRRAKPQTSSRYPYIRGTDLYRRSYENRHVAPPGRQAIGLPPYHNEAMWRDPPG